MKVWVEASASNRYLKLIVARLRFRGHEVHHEPPTAVSECDLCILVLPCRHDHRITVGMCLYQQRPPVVVFRPKHEVFQHDIQDDFCKATATDLDTLEALLIGMESGIRRERVVA